MSVKPQQGQGVGGYSGLQVTGMIEGYSGICLGGKIWQVFFWGVGGLLVGIFWGIQIF